MKYYNYTFQVGRHSGEWWILAENEEEARKKLKGHIHKYHPFKKYVINLINVIKV